MTLNEILKLITIEERGQDIFKNIDNGAILHFGDGMMLTVYADTDESSPANESEEGDRATMADLRRLGLTKIVKPHHDHQITYGDLVPVLANHLTKLAKKERRRHERFTTQSLKERK